MLIRAGGEARRRRQILRSEEVDHQAALLGVVVMKVVVEVVMNLTDNEDENKIQEK